MIKKANYSLIIKLIDDKNNEVKEYKATETIKANDKNPDNLLKSVTRRIRTVLTNMKNYD